MSAHRARKSSRASNLPAVARLRRLRRTELPAGTMRLARYLIEPWIASFAPAREDDEDTERRISHHRAHCGEHGPGNHDHMGPATTDIKDAQLRGRFDLDTLRGPAITEIDAPHLRGRRRLNRRANLILSQSPSTDGNAREFAGNRCGNTVRIWELDRVSLRSMASGGDRPFVEPITLTQGARLGHGTPQERSHSRLVLSGLMSGEESDVLAAFAPWRVDYRAGEDEWVCCTLVRS